MTAPESTRGSARPVGKQGHISSGVAARAFENLARLACGISRASSAEIHAGTEPARLIASSGTAGSPTHPIANRTVIPIRDAAGRVLGSLTLLDDSAAVLTEEQGILLEGLAGQAAALLELDGAETRRAAPLESAAEGHRDGGAKPPETAFDPVAIAIDRERYKEISRKNQELSEQNLRIQEDSRMKSEFLANMSHELRTPLNAIIGFSQLLIDNKVGRLTEKQSEYLGDILDGGMHLLRLINDVIDLAKIEAGRMGLSHEDINLPQAMRDVSDTLLPMALGKGVTVSIAADPEAENARLDGAKVRRVLYNLMSNAIKFSHPSGKVSVAARRDAQGGIRLEVTDEGIGIRKEDLGKLFRQFQQLDPGSARRHPGSGLGLVITKKLLELCHGTVEVRSERGLGSTFTAVFPRHEGPLEAPQQARPGG